MAKFGRDCMLKMNEILRRVSDRLGPDTCNLQFRVGLHSGSVTGGILRGQKARFQLFGDAVNTGWFTIDSLRDIHLCLTQLG